MKGKTHDLNHDLTFSAHTINCVCHSIRSMFRVLGIYNFEEKLLFPDLFSSLYSRMGTKPFAHHVIILAPAIAQAPNPKNVLLAKKVL